MLGQLFDTSRGITVDSLLEQYRIPGTDKYELAEAPSTWEYLKANAALTFEDYTLVGRSSEERRIMGLEKEAGTYDPTYYAYDPLAGGVREANRYAMSEEEWKQSEWYRKEIPYADNMTPQRAQVLAEGYDERQYRKALIAKGDEAFGLMKRGLGFGAMLVGGMIDPINLIPFSGGMTSAKTAVTAALAAALHQQYFLFLLLHVDRGLVLDERRGCPQAEEFDNPEIVLAR